jgi:hypothetical protein
MHMRISCLALLMITLATAGLPGCGDDGGAGASSGPFAIEGSWLFLGPTGPGHVITISSTSMKYKATEQDWESNWTIKKHDDKAHQFQITFDSGHGTYYPEGQSLSGTFDLTGPILTVQLAKGLDSYPPLKSPGSCTDGSDAIPDCKLYMKQ